jgi:hypothetical protein
MVERIITYTPSLRDDIERFRDQTFLEGNESLSHAKFDPDNLQGRIWMAYEDDLLVSISAAEVSHYTDETDVIRKCRYHILKSHRHGRYGFKFLRQMVPWARSSGYKVLYWTHDVNNVALNALYQRKRTYGFGGDNSWFDQWPYTELVFERDMLFRTGSMLQFIYSIYLEDGFTWRPPACDHIVYHQHDGQRLTIKDISQ